MAGKPKVGIELLQLFAPAPVELLLNVKWSVRLERKNIIQVALALNNQIVQMRLIDRIKIGRERLCIRKFSHAVLRNENRRSKSSAQRQMHRIRRLNILWSVKPDTLPPVLIPYADCRRKRTNRS